jgi:hypothetical protein
MRLVCDTAQFTEQNSVVIKKLNWKNRGQKKKKGISRPMGWEVLFFYPQR